MTTRPVRRPRRIVVQIAGVILALSAAGCGSTVSKSERLGILGGQPNGGGNTGLSGGPSTGTGPAGPGTAAGSAGATGLPGSQPGSSGIGTSGAPGSAVGAGGGSTGGGSTGGGTGPAVRKGPIKVGFVAADFSKAAAAVGFAGAAPASPQQFFQWLVKYYNAHGGLAGRTIQPVYATVDGAAADYNAASQGACETLTQDNHVELVMSYLWVNPTLVQCLLNQGIPQIEGTELTNNSTPMLARTPNLFIPDGLTSDRQGQVLIKESIRLGWLTTKSKLGIVHDTCPYSTYAVKNSYEPLLRQYKIPFESYEAFECGAGFSDVGAFTSGIQSAELKMYQDGATHITFMQNGENGGLTFFGRYAEQQRYRPIYLASSHALLMSTKSQGDIMPKEQLKNVRLVGWVPKMDTDKPQKTALMRTCIQHSIEGGGHAPANLNDETSMYAACHAFAFSDAVLRLSGGAGELAAFRPAAERLGTSFVSVSALSQRTQFGPGRHDGSIVYAPSIYVAKCDCFQYVGPPRQVS